MKTSSAGELESLLDDLPPARAHSSFDLCQVRGIEHDDWAARFYFRRYTKSACQSAVAKAGVIRTVVGELPTENL